MLGKLIIQSTKVISVIIILITFGCKPESLELSVIPEIGLLELNVLKNIEEKDSVIQLVISYQDGDGNIGLTDADTLPPYDLGSPFSHNLPVTFMVGDGAGGFTELVNSRTGKLYGNNHARVPIITPTGKYKSITGEMTINLTANPASENPKELFIELQLIDRALNVSNKIITEVINLTH